MAECTTTNTTSTTTAAVLRDDGTLTRVNLDNGNRLRDMYQLIKCRAVDVVALARDLDMWLDDEGMYVNPTPNWFATAVARDHGYVFQPYFGDVVFTGGADDEGDTLPLSDDRFRELGGRAAALRAGGL